MKTLVFLLYLVSIPVVFLDAAPSGDAVKNSGREVTTRVGSRAEARLDHRGSLVRLGSNTVVQVGNQGGMSLSKGVVLVSSGQGLLRRPAVQVRTPRGEVSVRGSAIIAALPDGSVKMTCLEGAVRGSLGGQGMRLDPGHLIVQRREGTRDAVQVNLDTLVGSSALLDPGSFKPLPVAPQIQQEAVRQLRALVAAKPSGGEHAVQLRTGDVTDEVKEDARPGFLTRLFTPSNRASDSPHNTSSSVVLSGTSALSKSGSSGVLSSSNLIALSVSGSNVIGNQVSNSYASAGTMVISGGTATGNVLAARDLGELRHAENTLSIPAGNAPANSVPGGLILTVGNRPSVPDTNSSQPLTILGQVPQAGRPLLLPPGAIISGREGGLVLGTTAPQTPVGQTNPNGALSSPASNAGASGSQTIFTRGVTSENWTSIIQPIIVGPPSNGAANNPGTTTGGTD